MLSSCRCSLRLSGISVRHYTKRIASLPGQHILEADRQNCWPGSPVSGYHGSLMFKKPGPAPLILYTIKRHTSLLQYISQSVGFGQRKVRMNFSGRAADRMYYITSQSFDFNDMIAKLDLPDVYFSWFVLMELHIWMLIVRINNAGLDDTAFVKNALIKALWWDTALRLKKLVKGTKVKVGHRPTLKLLHRKFLGHTMAYDEGMLSSDAVLAAALWRNMFNRREDLTPETLDVLVHYIRRNLTHLEALNSADVIVNGLVSFVPFGQDEIDRDRVMEIQHFICKLFP